MEYFTSQIIQKYSIMSKSSYSWIILFVKTLFIYWQVRLSVIIKNVKISYLLYVEADPNKFHSLINGTENEWIDKWRNESHWATRQPIRKVFWGGEMRWFKLLLFSFCVLLAQTQSSFISECFVPDSSQC